MIHVDRSKIAIPIVLVEEAKGGKKETQKAINFYHKKLAKILLGKELDQLTDEERFKVIHFMDQPLALSLVGENFKFNIYNEPEVKRALADLFHGKCAYCESHYSGTQPMDVEHWRPKGGFVDEGDPDKEKMIWPGYFWLAADWNNLLPSCIDCNRRRNQVVWSQDKPLRMGKESQFPVADEQKRWRYPDQYGDPSHAIEEEPLLLDPCDDKQENWPEKHLTFNLKEATLLPLPDPKNANQSSPKALASIRVYALNRTDLVLARQERLRLLEYHRYTIIKLAELLELLENHQDELAIVEDLLTYEFAALDRFKDPDMPYSLLATNFIEAFEKELNPSILERFSIS